MLKLFVGLIGLLFLSVPASSNEDIHDRGEYASCDISYHIRLQPGKNVDTGPYTRQFSACVKNLSDCHRRGAALAKEHARWMDQPTEGTSPDLNSIRISSRNIDGHCRELD